MCGGDGLNNQVFELFLKFSRLEYALTRVDGFARGKRRMVGAPVFPDWEALARCLGRDFFNEQKADPQKKILWDEPPGQWVVGSCDASGRCSATWRQRQTSTELQKSFEPIKWVRNCVIHGESQDMVPRYIQLVAAAVAVLDSTVERCREQDDLREIANRYKGARVQESGSSN